MNRPVTVWGRASTIGGLAAETSGYGKHTFMRGAHSYDDLEAALPDDGVEVDADHNGERLGQLIYAEISPTGEVNAVCVLDDDRICEVEQDVFFSPTFLMQGDVDRPTYIARSAKLLGVSLTHSPATVAARPVEWRAGDLRRSADTYTWPGSWRYHDPLLARAVDQVGDGFASRDRAATRIVDRRDDGYGYGPPPIRSWDRMQTRDWRTLPGGLMKSAHRGRVMRVY